MPGLFDRIKRVVRSMQPKKMPDYDVPPEPGVSVDKDKAVPEFVRWDKDAYLSAAEKTNLIKQSAARYSLVYLQYNGQLRYVEPYSFRQGNEGTLFFGHDLSRNDTRSYYIHKIEEIHMTDIPYNPRWMVDL